MPASTFSPLAHLRAGLILRNAVLQRTPSTTHRRMGRSMAAVPELRRLPTCQMAVEVHHLVTY